MLKGTVEPGQGGGSPQDGDLVSSVPFHDPFHVQPHADVGPFVLVPAVGLRGMPIRMWMLGTRGGGPLVPPPPCALLLPVAKPCMPCCPLNRAHRSPLHIP